MKEHRVGRWTAPLSRRLNARKTHQIAFQTPVWHVDCHAPLRRRSCSVRAFCGDSEGEEGCGDESAFMMGLGMLFPGTRTSAAAAKAATQASVADKLSRYLLNPNHPIGRDKAKWFKEALGFTQSNADGLARQIVFDASKAVRTAVTEHGVKFNQVISITGANGRVIDVTFAWIRNNDGIVRLVIGIPSKL